MHRGSAIEKRLGTTDLEGDFEGSFLIIEGGRKTKQIKFQKRWLKE